MLATGRSLVLACLGTWLGAFIGTVQAKIVETVIDLPASVTDIHGQTTSRAIKVTIFRDDAKARSPFMILNHGRSPHSETRLKPGIFRMHENSRYFVAKGFAVFVPTRIGYGSTGGPDVEYSGDCNTKNYPPVYDAAARQSIAIIDYAKTLPYIDPAKGIVMGQSFGGMTAIAIAARQISGVVAAVNFAGGGGGNPETRPGRPCRDDLLAALFSSYGTTARIPTLWLYSENDQYFGKDKPRAWFKAFAARGGNGEFVQLPPHGADGHTSFTANPAAWKPSFEAFLNALGNR